MRRLVAAALLSTMAAGAEPLAGRYAGDWAGAVASGDFRLLLEPQAGGKWKLEVSFTLGGQQVQTATTFVRVAGHDLEARYEYNLGDSRLESHIQGRLREGRLQGTYRARVPPSDNPVDEGAWQATRVKQ